MDNDDRPVGRVLSRREVLALFSTFGAAVLAACAGLDGDAPPTSAAAPTAAPTAVPSAAAAEATAGITAPATAAPQAPSAQPATPLAAVEMPTCIVRPEMTEGPFFVDVQLDRSDIRLEPSDGSVSTGAPLELTFQVTQLANNACTALPGAIVDVWHCDALGVYSGVGDQRDGVAAAASKFLRGHQVTDAAGRAHFTTIYPGWYPGRTVHIHFKIRAEAGGGRLYDFTSQLFFDDALSDQVFTQAPYAARGERSTRNSDDGLFRSGGDQLLLEVQPSGSSYAANFRIGLDLSA